ncbi:MAG: M1 family metallopeptidase [Chloroflexi bacterium]|nr:M1 family metallopeptidase [Chloroflexota bacterium]
MPQRTPAKHRSKLTFMARAGWLLLLIFLVGCSSFGGTKKESSGKSGKGNTLAELLLSSPVKETTPVGGPDTTPVPLPEGCGLQESQAMRPAFSADIFLMENAPCYDIEVTINHSFRSLTGKETVYFTNQGDTPLKSLFFRIYPQANRVYGGKMTVSKAIVNRVEVLPEVAIEEEDGTAVRLPLFEPLEPGRHLIIKLWFEAEIPRDFGGDVKTSSSYGIFNYSDGILTLANWYPILAISDKDGWHLPPVSEEGDAVFSEAALYHVILHTDIGVTPVSTGQQIHKYVTPWGDMVYEMVSGPTRDFMLVLSKDLKVARQDEEGVLVNTYYLPKDAAASANVLNFTVTALRTYQDLFGAYPYRELDVVDVPLNRAAGVEYPGMFLIGRNLYQNEGDPFLEFAVAHETAHQWWYAIVGNDVINAPWLDEALANYSAALYMEKAHGSAGLQQTLDNWEQILNRWKSDHPDEPVAQPLSEFKGREDAYSVIVYVKGALFFHALREKIGDQAFFESLKQYYQAHRYGIAQPADLLQVFETTSGQDLGDLYQEWGVQ